MAKSTRRTEQKQKDRQRRKSMKEARMRDPNAKHDSNYSRKSKFLTKHGLWGFEIPEPKPWRKSA